jgi:hypothetical protein
MNNPIPTTASVQATSANAVVAPLSGSVARILVEEGDEIEAGQVLLRPRGHEDGDRDHRPADGTVARILVAKGESVAGGEALIELEVGDADGTHSAPSAYSFSKAFHVSVGQPTAGDRPMHQVQVDHVDAEGGAALLEGLQRVVVALIPVAELRGDEDGLPGQAGRLQRGAHACFVVVPGGRVDVPVADGQRLLGDLLGLLDADPEGPEAELGDLDAVVEFDEGLSAHAPTLVVVASTLRAGCLVGGACGLGTVMPGPHRRAVPRWVRRRAGPPAER